jgi:hypothetical protein
MPFIFLRGQRDLNVVSRWREAVPVDRIRQNQSMTEPWDHLHLRAVTVAARVSRRKVLGCRHGCVDSVLGGVG